MSIFVDETTKVVYQGLTGSQGRFYGLRNRDYGTQVVAGTNPKKAGTDVDGIPIYASVPTPGSHRRHRHCIFIPAPGVKAAVMEAAEAAWSWSSSSPRGASPGRGRFFNKVSRDFRAPHPRPELPRLISPGKCTSASPPRDRQAGGPVGS